MRSVLLSLGVLAVAACTDDTVIQAPREVRQINVTGEGIVSAVPDLVVLTFSVRSQAENAADAFGGTSRLANAVLAEMEKQGVEARDRQTGQVSLNPIYARDDRRGYDRTQVVAYEAYNSLIVRLRDIDRAGEVIDAAVRAGANGLDSFQLTFDDPRSLQDQARISAVQDAVAKARDMAGAAGAELGEVISLSANGGYSPQPSVRMRSMEAVADAAPMISAGEQDLRVTVSATFYLK